MKRALLAGVAAYFIAGAPGAPEPFSAAPASAQSGAVCGTVYCAVIQTAKKVYDGNCAPGTAGCDFDPVKAAIKGAWEGATTTLCPTTPLACNILKIAGHWGMEMPYSLTKKGGSFGGAGADGEWLTDDCRFDVGLDAEGNLLLPSIKLPAGQPMVRSTSSPSPFYTATGSGSIPTYFSLGYLPSLLFHMHHRNMNASQEMRAWFGVYSVTATGIKTAKPAYFNTTGALVSRATFNKDTNGAYAFNTAFPQDCPAAGSSGGDFDFYVNYGTKECIWYAPNLALSKTGYAMNDKTSVLFSSAGTLKTTLAGHPFLKCPLSNEFIATLARAALDKTPYANHDPGPDDAQTGGEEPTVEDLDDSTPDTETGTQTPPTPEPTPTPTPTPSDGPDYDPTVTLSDPQAPEIDWWPDLPTLDLNLGTPECPVYTLSLTGWWSEPFILDSHCALVEQNRAAISVLMTAMFAMMGLFIVLRA